MLTNGEYFIGNFSEDMIQGSGKFFGKDGTIKGYWEANQLQRIDWINILYSHLLKNK